MLGGKSPRVTRNPPEKGKLPICSKSLFQLQNFLDVITPTINVGVHIGTAHGCCKGSKISSDMLKVSNSLQSNFGRAYSDACSNFEP